MDECKVTRQKAVKALKKSNNDVVNAILSFNE
jgi:NACalpha-BTF3-like transcription factor